MPTLYRSRSVRRFDESANRLTNIIEKDNIKVNIYLLFIILQAKIFKISNLKTVKRKRNNCLSKIYNFILS